MVLGVDKANMTLFYAVYVPLHQQQTHLNFGLVLGSHTQKEVQSNSPGTMREQNAAFFTVA